MKLWAGRFSKEVDETVNDFNSSISFDARMAEQDILGSMAHAKMLVACGIVSAEDAEAILCGLAEILEELKRQTCDRPGGGGYSHLYRGRAHGTGGRRRQAAAHGQEQERSGGAGFAALSGRSNRGNCRASRKAHRGAVPTGGKRARLPSCPDTRICSVRSP